MFLFHLCNICLLLCYLHNITALPAQCSYVTYTIFTFCHCVTCVMFLCSLHNINFYDVTCIMLLWHLHNINFYDGSCIMLLWYLHNIYMFLCYLCNVTFLPARCPLQSCFPFPPTSWLTLPCIGLFIRLRFVCYRWKSQIRYRKILSKKSWICLS